MNINSFFEFKFDIGYLFVFLSGIVFGFLVLVLLYLYTLLKTMQSKRFYRKAVEPDIDEEEIKLLIKDAQSLFKDKKARDENGLFLHLKMISTDLAKDIATKFYPNSKYPLLELTIDETLMLGHYITDRVDKIMNDSRFLKLLRRRTLANLMQIYSVKATVEESAIVQTEKKYKIRKRISDIFNVINFARPAYWIKKITVDQITQQFINRICLAIIGIVGEETYKIYSKNVFAVEKTIDAGVESIYDEIREESSIVEGEDHESI